MSLCQGRFCLLVLTTFTSGPCEMFSVARQMAPGQTPIYNIIYNTKMRGQGGPKNIDIHLWSWLAMWIYHAYVCNCMYVHVISCYDMCTNHMQLYQDAISVVSGPDGQQCGPANILIISTRLWYAAMAQGDQQFVILNWDVVIICYGFNCVAIFRIFIRGTRFGPRTISVQPWTEWLGSVLELSHQSWSEWQWSKHVWNMFFFI